MACASVMAILPAACDELAIGDCAMRRLLPMGLFLLCGSVGILLAAEQSKGPGAKGKGKGKPEIEAPDPWGKPDGKIYDRAARFQVWYEKDGAWRLRTTAKKVRNFSGTIKVANGRIASCVPMALKDGRKSNDAFRVNDQRDTLTFAFQTSRRADGFDLKVKGDDAKLEFDLALDGARDAKHVFIGERMRHPAKVPFTLPANPPKPE